MLVVLGEMSISVVRPSASAALRGHFQRRTAISLLYGYCASPVRRELPRNSGKFRALGLPVAAVRARLGARAPHAHDQLFFCARAPRAGSDRLGNLSRALSRDPRRGRRRGTPASRRRLCAVLLLGISPAATRESPMPLSSSAAALHGHFQVPGLSPRSALMRPECTQLASVSCVCAGRSAPEALVTEPMSLSTHSISARDPRAHSDPMCHSPSLLSITERALASSVSMHCRLHRTRAPRAVPGTPTRPSWTPRCRRTPEA